MRERLEREPTRIRHRRGAPTPLEEHAGVELARLARVARGLFLDTTTIDTTLASRGAELDDDALRARARVVLSRVVLSTLTCRSVGDAPGRRRLA